MIDPTSIRNATFGLRPTGYAPYEVDETLDRIANAIDAGDDPSPIIRAASFPSTSIGYAPSEVDEFLRQFADPGDAPSDETVEPRHDSEQDSPQVHTAEPPDSEPVPSGDRPERAGAEESAPAAQVRCEPAPPDPRLLETTLERAAVALGGLQGMVEDEISAVRDALMQQGEETARHCEALLAAAQADVRALRDRTAAEIAKARKDAAAEIGRDQRASAKAIRAAHAKADKEIARARARANDEIAAARDEAERISAEAQQVADRAIAMQATIAESLQRAQQQLEPPGGANVAA